MIMNSDKKIICVREIPSNIIEEAIFILKENIVDSQDEIREERSKEIILNEAEEIVEEYINEMEYKVEEYEDDFKKDSTWLKEVIYIIGLLIILGICIFVVM